MLITKNIKNLRKCKNLIKFAGELLKEMRFISGNELFLRFTSVTLSSEKKIQRRHHRIIIIIIIALAFIPFVFAFAFVLFCSLFHLARGFTVSSSKSWVRTCCNTAVLDFPAFLEVIHAFSARGREYLHNCLPVCKSHLIIINMHQMKVKILPFKVFISLQKFKALFLFSFKVMDDFRHSIGAS